VKDHGLLVSVRRKARLAGSSDRGFGLTVGGIFMLLGLWPLVHGFPPRWYFVGPAALLIIFGVIAPRVLAPLNHAWMRLGLMLHRVVAPVLMGIVFFGVILPTGVVMRLRGKDMLRLKLDPGATSYWIVRDPPGPAPDGLKNQF
jgi:hypothetical protein